MSFEVGTMTSIETFIAMCVSVFPKTPKLISVLASSRRNHLVSLTHVYEGPRHEIRLKLGESVSTTFKWGSDSLKAE